MARASCSPAPGFTATVAPFRAWRSSRLTVAGKPTRAGGDYRHRCGSVSMINCYCLTQTGFALCFRIDRVNG